MKIRDRLTYSVSLTALIAIAILGMFVYFFSAQFYQEQFFLRLEERIELSKIMFLENETNNPFIRDQFSKKLDEEREYVIPLDLKGIDSLRKLFPDRFTVRIQDEKMIHFRQGKYFGVGKKYELGGQEYVVIVSAIDTIGKENLNFLRQILSIGGILFIIVLIIVYRAGIIKALKPLENKIYRASQIRASNLDKRLRVRNPDDEVGQVAIAFNRMLDRLQVSFEAQREFVRNASHEMRNPLTAIRGEIEVLLDKERSVEEYQTTLTIIQKEANRLQELIQQLLALEKTDAMVDLADPSILSLGEIILEVIEQFPLERIKLEFASETNDCTILGNSALIYTAFSNLISNGLKYSDNEPITIFFTKEKNQLLVRIKDKGIGISETDLPLVLQPFFRAENARKEKGYGIGLTLTNKIISLHQGKIIFKSESNKGTTVSVYLPIVGNMT